MLTSQTVPSKRVDKSQPTGLLVLSPTWEVLHMNRIALKLLQETSAPPSQPEQPPYLPVELREVADKVKDSLMIERMSGLHHSIQVTTRMTTPTREILVKAFGLANPQQPSQYRILFTFSISAERK